MSPLVELVHLSKSFPGALALQDVHLRLLPGSVHALVGENGAGKSTLINVLSGVLRPDAGEVRVAGRAVDLHNAHDARRHGIVTVHQEVDLFPDLTVAENMGHEQGFPRHRLGWIDWSRQRRRTREALRALADTLPPGTPAGTLSPGQRQLVEIAAALAQDARVLILDEPTSSLSEAETRLLFEQLRRFRARGSALLYVSHRLEEIFELADEVTVLRNGCHIWTGPVANTSREHLIKLMVGREVQLSRRPAQPQYGPVRFACRQLTAADGSFHDVTLEVRGGEVLGLYGLIGAGRSEWAQAVFGLRPVARGSVEIDGQPLVPRWPGEVVARGLAYVPEDRLRQGLCRGLSVRVNLVLAALRQLARGLWLPRANETRLSRRSVAQLAIRLRDIEQPAGTLSGGNQQKVVLGRWLNRGPGVLIVDEPTRGIDVGARTEIYRLLDRLAAEGRALIVISSDLPEVLSQSDRVGVFRGGRLVATFDARQVAPEDVTAAAIPAETAEQPAETIRAGAGGWLSGLITSLHAGTLSLLRDAALLAAVAVLVALQPGNWANLATDTALLSFCAVGTTLVILPGGIDISIGALMALSAGVAGWLWEKGSPWPVVAAVAVGIGGAGGCLNAALSLLGRVHPIVVTLGTMSVFRGLVSWWIDRIGGDVQVAGSARGWLFDRVGGLSPAAWLGLAVAVGVWLLLSFTVTGREWYAMGSNPAAARRVGISRARGWLKAFTLQGLLVGLAGFLYLARGGNVQANSFDEITLEAIAAAVVGGVAIVGGRGSVWGVLLGCAFLVALAPACVFLGIPPYWQQTLVGSVLVLAVTADVLWRGRGP